MHGDTHYASLRNNACIMHALACASHAKTPPRKKKIEGHRMLRKKNKLKMNLSIICLTDGWKKTFFNKKNPKQNTKTVQNPLNAHPVFPKRQANQQFMSGHLQGAAVPGTWREQADGHQQHVFLLPQVELLQSHLELHQRLQQLQSVSRCGGRSAWLAPDQHGVTAETETGPWGWGGLTWNRHPPPPPHVLCSFRVVC